ncbi:hypothetical protein [uncultured Empedobacter sp.]|uniref:hypothetical protein n=1 Tax=uncultured Empedobacter sp. TaxID=410844 RepID=UPI00260DA5A9|nr:hypothetical protein [uncultured Empedobacter sp.]
MRKKLDKIIKKYISEFEKKHNLLFEFAVNNDLLNVLSFGSVYYFNTSDVIYDVDNNLPNGLIIEWLENNLENEQFINLESYSKGLRHNNL